MKPKDYLVVGMAASYGGLYAIQEFFDHLPEGSGTSFIIINHLSPNFNTLIPKLLSRHSYMTVFSDLENKKIEPDTIYFSNTTKTICIENGHIKTRPSDKGTPDLNPVDSLFSSLAKEAGKQAVGVVLSGIGEDGALGLKQIKEGGGMIFVQDPRSAQFEEMPNASIASNKVDYILTPDKIAIEIAQMAENLSGSKKNASSNARLKPGENGSEKRKPEIEQGTPEDDKPDYFNQIIRELAGYSRIPFHQYREEVLKQRIKSRMRLDNQSDPDKYLKSIQDDAAKKRELISDLLNWGDDFFENTTSYQQVKKRVLPKILETKMEGEVVNIWIAGCSEGKESYYLGIILNDLIEEQRSTVDFEIFSTDFDPEAVKMARTGYLPGIIERILPYSWLKYYFNKTNGKYRIIERIRNKFSFEIHDLNQAPPEKGFDYISCRNLLPFLKQDYRQQILRNLIDALKPGGYLFLDDPVGVPEISGLNLIAEQHLLYQKPDAVPGTPVTGNNKAGIPEAQKTMPSPRENQPMANIAAENQVKITQNGPEQLPEDEPGNSETPEKAGERSFLNCLIDLYAPSCIFFTYSYKILFLRGKARSFLDFPDGIFEPSLLSLTRGSLASEIIKGTGLIKKGHTRFETLYPPDGDKPVPEQVKLVFRRLPGKKDILLLEFHQPDEELVGKTSEPGKNRVSHPPPSTQDGKSKPAEEPRGNNAELLLENDALRKKVEELKNVNKQLDFLNEELYDANASIQNRSNQLRADHEAMIRTFTEASIGYAVIDDKLIIKSHNRIFRRFFDAGAEEEPINNVLIETFSKKTDIDLEQELEKVFRDKSPITKNARINEQKTCIIRFVPVSEEEPEANRVILTIQETDNSENEAGRNLLENEDIERFHLAFGAAEHGIWDWFTASDEAYYCKRWKKMLGFPEDATLNKYVSWQNLLHPDDFSRVQDELESFLQNPSDIFESHFRMKHTDGSYRWIHKRAKAVTNDEGIVTRMVGIYHDITMHKAAEYELQRLKQSMDQAPVSISITDLNGDFIYMNPKFAELTGYSKEELTGENISILESRIHDKNFYQDLWNNVRSGSNWQGELFIKRKDRNHYWEMATISPIKDSTGRITNFVKIGEDNTRKKKMEEELKVAKERAELANVHKNVFLANASHEIRTPLNGIIGFSELLKDPSMTEEEKNKYLEIINANSNQLLKLIDDIIDIAKIEAGELKINKRNTSVHKILKDIHLLYEQQKTILDRENIDIRYQPPRDHEDIVIHTDPIRLRQILSNIIGNALKFTKKGHVEFGYKVRKEEVEFYVSDSGIGIPESKQEKIYERFQQSDAKISEEYGGTGLGLAICKGLVSILGGEIWLNSEVNKGTSFYFTLPYDKDLIADEEIKTEKRYDAEKFEGATVLIAEDEENIHDYIHIILKKHNINTLWAKNGEEAIDLVKKNPEVNVVLMDIRMPKMDGLEATRKILEINPELPVIAQTAHAMQEEAERILSAGCIEVLKKPFLSNQLLETIGRHI
ncbi:MAG: chemotaxis protein CheB [Bacteroidales bacterium]